MATWPDTGALKRRVSASALAGWRRLGIFRAALVAVVAVPVLAVAHFTSTSYFFFDDYIYLRQAQRQGLSLGFLFQPLNPHLSPGHRLVNWLLQSVSPLDFGVAQGLLLACFAGSVVLVYRILVELCRPGFGPLLLTLLYATSIVHVGVIQWWNGGLLTLPAALLSLGCILAYLRFYRTGSRLLLALSVAVFVIALFFYLKAVLVPLYLVLLRVLVLEPQRPLRASLASVAREWRVWAAYLIPCAVYLAAFLSAYWIPSGAPSFDLVAGYLDVAWVRVFAPSVLGLRIFGEDSTAVEQVAIVAVQVAVVAVVVASLVRWRGAWRGWIFFAVAFVANALLVGLPRLQGWGAGIGYFPRYYLEATYLLPLAVGAAVLPRWRTGLGVLVAPSQVRSRLRLAGVGALGVLVVAHLALAWSGAERLSRESPGRLARPYMENVKAGLRQAARASLEPVIVDGVVPEYVVASWAVYGPPYHNRYSEVFPLLDPDLAFDQPSSALFEVGNDGTFQRVAFVPRAGGLAPRLWQDRVLSVSNATAWPAGDQLCVEAAATGGHVELTPAVAVSGEDLYLELLYSSQGRHDSTLAVDRGEGYSAVDDEAVVLEPGDKGATLVSLGGRQVERLRLNLPVEARVCLDRLELGSLVPRP